MHPLTYPYFTSKLFFNSYNFSQIGRALVLYQLDRPEETFQFFKVLSLKYPYFPDGNAILAVLYYEKGDVKAAEDTWENAVEEDSRYNDLDWVLNIRRW